jgi:TRAP-type mannitol/chloroaromatic compound transport system permease small subunit
MKRMLRVARILDRLSEVTGTFVGWLTLAMILIGAYNAIVRYLGHFFGWSLSSNAYIELQWYLFSLVFLLGAAYTLRCGAHVRVDVLYGQLGERGRAWINLLGTLFFLLPFSVFALQVSWASVRNSWIVREVSPDPGGLPRYPIKTMILVAFVLLILQGISEAIKQVAILKGVAHEEIPNQISWEEMG